MNYFIVSPIKNESLHLEALFDSVCLQTKLPILWMFIDDGSTDNSIELIKSFAEKKSFIKYIRIESAQRRNLLGVYDVIKKGIDAALKDISHMKLAWDYLSILDGDMELPPDYYEVLLNRFKQNKELYIARGCIWSLDNGTYNKNKTRVKNNPGNSARVISKKCFDEFGFPTYPSADTALNILVRNRGYQTIEFDDLKAFQNRLSNEAEGKWKGMILLANERYYLGFGIDYAFFYFFYQVVKFPFYHSFAFLFTYLGNLIAKKERVPNNEILQHNKKRLVKNLLRLFKLS